jgi:hypothetical protein
MAESVLTFLVAAALPIVLALICRAMLLRFRNTAWQNLVRSAFPLMMLLWASVILPSRDNGLAWQHSGFQTVAGLLAGLCGAILILVFAELKLQRIRRARGFPIV